MADNATFLVELRLTLDAPAEWPLVRSMLQDVAQRARANGDAVLC